MLFEANDWDPVWEDCSTKGLNGGCQATNLTSLVAISHKFKDIRASKVLLIVYRSLSNGLYDGRQGVPDTRSFEVLCSPGRGDVWGGKGPTLSLLSYLNSLRRSVNMISKSTANF